MFYPSLSNVDEAGKETEWGWYPCRTRNGKKSITALNNDDSKLDGTDLEIPASVAI